MDLKDIVGLAGVPLVVALVEATKLMFPELGKRWLPAISIGFGLAINLGFALSQIGDVRLAVLYGVVAGMAASGLYSNGMALVKREGNG